MDETEWFEKHPSYLKYKKIMMLTSSEMDALDATQIDKSKVSYMIVSALEEANENIKIEGQGHPDNLSAYIDLDFEKIAKEKIG